MKARDIREMSAEELDQKVRTLTREARDLRVKNRSGDTAEKPVRIRMLRRDIARLLTVSKEREVQS